jgi:hypothetical protein
VLVYLQQRERERVVYGDGEFGVDEERDGEGDGDEHDALERALAGEGSDDRGVEGEGGEDSDSSLDLHTPLP